MVDPGVYLEKLSAFCRMLRLAGFAVSPQETADAAQILCVLGMEDRGQVKTALRTVFAKTQEELETFDRVFDGFFIGEEAMRKQAKEQAQRDLELEQARQQAEEDLMLNGEPMDLSDMQRDAYASMPQQARDRLLQFKHRYQDNAARNPELYANFIHSVFAKAILEQQMAVEDAGIGVDSADPDLGLMYRDISDFKDTEIPKAISILQKISQQINAELSARRVNKGHSGQLNFRRTIRKGLETGGSFYRLHYKKKPRKKRHLVMLCDVSGSMMQFSEFALRLIQQLNHVSDSSRVFLFSENLFEASAFHLQNMDMFRNFARESGAYGRGTDLGTALETLCQRQPAVLNDSTTLLILSDTKTIDLPRALQALQEAKRLSGRVIWLNPIPESKWQYLRSVQSVLNICTMVCCNTLHALAAACRKLAQI